MIGWDHVVDILRESIFAYAQACNGNLGFGILIVTFLARLAVLPIGIRLARAAASHQRAMARLQPELDRIKARYRDQSVAPGRRNSARLRAREPVAPSRRRRSWKPRPDARVRGALFERPQGRRVGRPILLDSKSVSARSLRGIVPPPSSRFLRRCPEIPAVRRISV